MFNAHKLALAASGTVGIFHIVCSALTALWPETSLNLMADMIFSTGEKMMPFLTLTWGIFFSSLIQSVVYTYIMVYVFGWMYNKMTK